MFSSVEEFRASRTWRRFVEALRLERALDGAPICEHCGKPIVRKGDCIGHHKVEVTEANVNDAMITLNPDNVDLVHLRCHNDIHGRWQGGNPYAKRKRGATIVYGAPCSGKTSYVRAHMSANDVVVDMDAIFAAVSMRDLYDKPERLLPTSLLVRDALLDHIATRGGKWTHAWVIGGYPLLMDRRRAADKLGADTVLVEASLGECLERCSARPAGWETIVRNWFDRFQPDPPPSSLGEML